MKKKILIIFAIITTLVVLFLIPVKVQMYPDLPPESIPLILALLLYLVFEKGIPLVIILALFIIIIITIKNRIQKFKDEEVSEK